MPPSADAGPNRGLHAIPRGIWALGLVSLLMDMSSELVHALLPVFLVSTLGVSALTVGVIEGIAEATAAITKVFSGALSDHFGRRKGLAVLGYGLAALTKPLFPLAGSAAWVFAARFIDRIGKGIRGAPRDALIGDIAPPQVRGAAYGLRQSLDTVGAFIGPGLAIGLMLLLADDIRAVFWFAVGPAFLSVLVLVIWVREPHQKVRSGDPQPIDGRFRRRALRTLGDAFWQVTAVGAALTLARFSEAFLVLRAQDAGFGVAWVPAVMIVMSAVYAASSYPAGELADRIDRTAVLAAGFVVLVLADIVLALADRPVTVMAGVALWGLHMGLTQGLLATLVTDTAPARLRGTAFGVFNLITGFATVVASMLAGLLWDLYGPTATFLAGAGFTIIALAGLLVVRRRR